MLIHSMSDSVINLINVNPKSYNIVFLAIEQQISNIKYSVISKFQFKIRSIS